MRAGILIASFVNDSSSTHKVMLKKIWITLALLLMMSVPRSSRGLEIICQDEAVIPMGSITHLDFKVGLNHQEMSTWKEDELVKLDFNLTNDNSWALDLMNASLEFSLEDILWSRSKPIFVKALVIGVDTLEVTPHLYHKNGTLIKRNASSPTSFAISAVLADRTLNDIFTIIMISMIIVNTVNMGGQLDLHIIKEVFKRPVGPIVGFTSQFVIMPLLSYGVGALMFEDKLFRLGLFVLGCSPGGNGSNFWTLLLNGDINLSITMTFVSTIAALGMMPLWIFVLGSTLNEGDLVIPYGQLFISLIALIGPISLGMWIRFRFEKGAKIMKAVIVPFTLLTVLFIFTVGIYINLFIFMLITWKTVMAGFLVAFCGYAFGAIFAWLCRLNVAQITAVSIETAFQNGGIAFVLLKLSLPPPFGDMAAVAPVSQLMLTGLPLWVILAIWKLYQKCFLQKKTKEEDERKQESVVDEKELLSRLVSLPDTNV